MQSVDLTSSVATTQDGSYMGLSANDKNIIRELRKINEAFKSGNTHLTLVFDGSNLEIRSDNNKCEYCDMIEEYKNIKIIGVDKKSEKRNVKEKTVKDMLKDIDDLNKKEKRKRKYRENKKAKVTIEDKTIGDKNKSEKQADIEKPKRKRRTKAEMEEARRLEQIVSDDNATSIIINNDGTTKPKRKRRTKKEMEEYRKSLEQN